MENISPTLKLTLLVRAALENGSSVRIGVLQFLSNSNDPFASLISKWLLFIDQDQPFYHLIDSLHPCRRSLLILLEKGLKGHSILLNLEELESEIIQSCESEIENQIQKLPILLMIPVFLFMFPAYLILLFGPIIQSLLIQISQ